MLLAFLSLPAATVPPAAQTRSDYPPAGYVAVAEDDCGGAGQAGRWASRRPGAGQTLARRGEADAPHHRPVRHQRATHFSRS